jgi:dipeptidyl aminopeptidase/acylaminoacyl peptidase
MVRASTVAPPAELVADGVPPVPHWLDEQVRPYLDYRSARLLGWHPVSRAILIGTRSDNSRQLYEVDAPGATPRQLSFSDEPVIGGEYAPVKGDVTLAIADTGGDEQYQIYRVEDGGLRLLTDGKSRNLGVRWTSDGSMIGYSTTRRTGLDTDLHLMNPRDPSSDRMVMAGRGGGWSFADFSPDGRHALLFNYLSVAQSGLYEFDIDGRVLRSLNAVTTAPVSYGTARYGPDRRIFAITDHAAEHRYLAEIDRATGQPKRLNPEVGWGVEDFDIDPAGRFIAYVVNEHGFSRLRLIELDGGTPRSIDVGDGVITGLEIAPWGEIGISMSTASSPGDVWSIDPDTLRLKRWTDGRQAGADPAANARPELLTVRSFDGTAVSGFLYRPDPHRFPGRRPLLISFHGGPEGQSRPAYLGRNNYLVNELGVALFLPNVRGSTGYGKRFVALDNGPERREDSVRDVSAFLRVLERDPGIDSARMAVTGSSYGGYMTLASLARYPRRFRAGISVVGISNFVTFLEGTRGYRRDLRRIEYGDERVPRQRRKLEAISPLTRASRIRAPLLVVTGANDPRVPRGEADAIVAAVRAAGGEAWHIVADDEGHGFAKKSNADYQFMATVLFLRQHLLGLIEPVHIASR